MQPDQTDTLNSCKNSKITKLKTQIDFFPHQQIELRCGWMVIDTVMVSEARQDKTARQHDRSFWLGKRGRLPWLENRGVDGGG